MAQGQLYPVHIVAEMIGRLPIQPDLNFHNASPRGVMSFCVLNAKVRPAQPHADESAFVPLHTRHSKQQVTPAQ